MRFSKILTLFLLVAFTGALLTGCDTTNISPDTKGGEGKVQIQFKSVPSSSSAEKASSGATADAEHDSLVIEGANGTLQIDDIRFIVEKFKLEMEEMENDSVESGEEELEAGPFFVDLPLNEDILSLAADEIPAGFYEELEFEVNDLDLEDEREEEAEEDEESDVEEYQSLEETIRLDYPEWPKEASMVVMGSYTPDGGTPEPFKVFAKAEIEIEMEFDPPLEITEDNIERVVSVELNPVRWLEEEGGNVVDLSVYDWEEHQELLEFSVKFKDGVEDVKVEDDDFYEDEDGDEEDEDEEEEEED
ncbi:hypothetical protein [Fodinibius sediminis]|uniref:DUF4382 domain-containing protein n=1 Tax=Fodinibius sediminis TaxID=1214077 RepID=A0A521CGT5_9BACT|nr:hypothetical protein [Fodinibius sediminis]SMO58677.1 hypothetical protein SAMN06265218_10675 [Fodinibius sediminis]